MKFIIFADKSYNYVKPIADGLYNEIKGQDHDVEIWYDGVYWLAKVNLLKCLLRDIYKIYKNIIKRNSNLYIPRFFNILFFLTNKKITKLNACDCIIVVNNCPTVFYKNAMPRIEYLRGRFRKPIVNYDFHFLPNQGWYKRILEIPNSYGLERFDWYLPVGLITEYKIPKEIPQIYNCIGMNITSDDLYPEQKDFIALLDFRRKGYEKERDIVISTLNILGIKYIELSGLYTRTQIRNIYRKCSIYFLSIRESFGLPISELQLCGCYIFTPYKEWCPAYGINKDIYENGVKELGSNFVVYDNNPLKLKTKVLEIKRIINPNLVVKRFKDEYPMYNSINRMQIELFIQNIKNGTITQSTHLCFEKYNKYISQDDNVTLY